ncbi:hypothetical protein PBY51_016007 [Eleginops maclovinus]|uniref:Uncharacterized protein n=1 Tax=Eleginops maclovinus TaxID=56733 RepID=A0AAN8AQF5_ELEMC|nr:hypothetical protein PBY51_016007 [Eleginops maclovinus]
MESVRSAFHAQLATVMDSLLAAAVCEIAKIFESSLCEQQAQKTEEISILRGKLEKVEKRQKGKSGGNDEGELLSGDREGSMRQQTPIGSGLNVGQDLSSDLDPVEGLSQSLSGMKEEVTGQDGASVKHERAGSQPTVGSVTVQVPEVTLAAGEQRKIHTLSATQAKAKLSHWDQGRADHRSLRDQVSTPFLSISQSGRCSPRPDPDLAQPGEWLLGLDGTKGGVSGLENMQAEGTNCSGPASSSTGTDTACFRRGFGSD